MTAHGMEKHSLKLYSLTLDVRERFSVRRLEAASFVSKFLKVVELKNL